MVEPARLNLLDQGKGHSPHISHSGLSTLAECERKWCFRYRDHLPAPPTPAMSKGLLFHRLWGVWWTSPDADWTDELAKFCQEWSAENPDAERFPDWLHDTAWLFGRYAEFYDDERQSGEIEVVGVEVPFRVRLPHRYGWVIGRFDSLWRIKDRLWLVEAKTMSDWDSLEAFCWDPQVSLYYFAALERGGEKPEGILLDAARTYRWRNPRPLEDSFQRRWLDRHPDHLEGVTLDVLAGFDRAKELRKGARPVRNVARHCEWCPFREPCRAELAFGDTGVDWMWTDGD